MSLILCPECGKEISDKVTACPHCGYPFSEQASPTVSSDSVEVAEVNIPAPKPKTSRTLIIGIIDTILVIVLIIVAVILKKSSDATKIRNEYIDNLSSIRSEMLQGAIDAEDICILTHDVWSDTIYQEYDSDTAVYTMEEFASFHEDFNDSIQALYADPEIQDTISAIETNKSRVDRLMKDLQNPADEFSACYATLDALYDSYCGLVDLATSPSGSLISYTESYREYDGDFGKYYEKLGTQIPEKRK